MSAYTADGPARVAGAGHVSWGAIMAGAVVAVAIGLMLNLLGAATASALVEMVSRETPSARAMVIGSGIWLAASTAIGLLIGALVAARLAGTWSATDAMMHGLSVWAVATLLAAALLGSALSGGVVAGVRGVGQVAGGVASATGAAAASVRPEQALEALQTRLMARADAGGMNRQDATAEVAEIMGRRLRDGSFSGNDRTRLESLVASAAGIPQAEASARISETEARLQATLREAEETARRAADTAAQSAAVTGFWAFAALLLGLGAAVLGARMGVEDRVPAYRDVSIAPR